MQSTNHNGNIVEIRAFLWLYDSKFIMHAEYRYVINHIEALYRAAQFPLHPFLYSELFMTGINESQHVYSV